MKAYIYVGGGIVAQNIIERPEADDLVIAADSGYNNAKAFGVSPKLLVGDFDSLGKENIPNGVKLVELPCEKDMTDTQAAVELALREGASDIVIIGGLDNRLDHAMSNLAILRELYMAGVHCIITDGANRVRYINSSSTLIARSNYRYFSILADDDKVKGIDIEGCKYPLRNATLTRRRQYAVSNEIEGNCAFIAVRRGGIYIIESEPNKS